MIMWVILESLSSPWIFLNLQHMLHIGMCKPFWGEREREREGGKHGVAIKVQTLHSCNKPRLDEDWHYLQQIKNPLDSGLEALSLNWPTPHFPPSAPSPFWSPMKHLAFSAISKFKDVQNYHLIASHNCM